MLCERYHKLHRKNSNGIMSQHLSIFPLGEGNGGMMVWFTKAQFNLMCAQGKEREGTDLLTSPSILFWFS